MQHLEHRRQAHRLHIMYKITNNHIDIAKHEYVTRANTYTDRKTKNTHTHSYITHSGFTNSYKDSYFPRTIRDWNGLPQHIIDSPTIQSFTNNLHKHLTPNVQH